MSGVFAVAFHKAHLQDTVAWRDKVINCNYNKLHSLLDRYRLMMQTANSLKDFFFSEKGKKEVMRQEII